jgi:hypothetical protein
MLARLVTLAVVVVVASACRCTEPIAQGAGGELVLVGDDGQVSAALAVDFGRVPVGAAVTRTVTLQNRGRSGLRLVAPEVTGDAVAAAGPFRWTSPDELGPGQTVTVEVGFAPGQVRPFLATVVVRSPDAAEAAREVTLSLTGEGIENACAVDEGLDFGEVALGEERERALVLDNPRDEPLTVTLSEVAAPFRQVAPGGRRVTVPARGTTSVRYAFRPSVAASSLTTVLVTLGSTCPEAAVRLRGAGIAEGLRLVPDPVDFGFAPPGLTSRRPLSVVNATARELSVALTFSSAEFSGPGQVTVPAFTTTPLEAIFRPAMLGARRGSVVARSGSLAATAQLRGVGGGPDVDVRPARLAFGRVALFQGVSPTPQARRLQVWNVGTRASGQREERLFLGDGGAGPLVSVEGVDGGAAPPGLTARLSAMPAFVPADGLEAGRFVAFDVELTPASVGRLEAQVVVSSNDPDEGEVRVPVTADVVALPPCALRVEPAGQLQFGTLTPGVPVVRAVVFENLSRTPGDVCLVSALELAPESHPAFALREGPVAEKELAPGQRWTVELQATSSGTGMGAISGALTWSSSSAAPAGRLQLTAAIDAACLTIAPVDLDVGGVGLGCTSGGRSVLLYNSCATPVTVTDLALIDAAGARPNSPPACPGATPCPEFAFSQRPPVPFTLAPGAAPVAVTVRYEPIDLGADVGALGVTSTAAGSPAVQVVTLRGEGAATGVVTDVFQGAGVPRVDVLFVIDGSCSMSSKQMSLASNLPAFFARTLSSAVDYQLAVVVGQGPPSVPSRGTFRFGPTHPTPILSRAVPDAERQFGARVTSIGAQGGNEECLQPALEALTPPLSVSSNAGFLRSGAQLAVVCVTDDSDYSPQPVSFYVAALTNLKQGRVNDLTISAIAGYTQTCPATQLENGRYATVTAATGGVREEICTADWAQSLGRLSLTTFGQSGRFFLRGTPDLSARPLEVRVDGQVVAAGTPPMRVWTYDVLGNAVVFEELYRPPAGARVEVTYQPTCR